LLLCVAETERPGRFATLDEGLFDAIQDALGVRFASGSAVIAEGRVGVAVALARARALLASAQQVVIAGVDSLVCWKTLEHYDAAGRLLSDGNANGFVPGEAAGAIVVGAPRREGDELLCSGIGFGSEKAHVDSDEPLRADGLAAAVRAALAESGCDIQDMDFRITDIAGEQYYFKEAALAVSRVLRVRKEEFDLWHPAECTGEIGAAAGLSVVAAAHASCVKRYGPGPRILVHMTTDAGLRAALALRYVGKAT
jgi:3-oxoacyl-[acyl-carrier-protein] synthase-1